MLVQRYPNFAMTTKCHFEVSFIFCTLLRLLGLRWCSPVKHLALSRRRPRVQTIVRYCLPVGTYPVRSTFLTHSSHNTQDYRFCLFYADAILGTADEQSQNLELPFLRIKARMLKWSLTTWPPALHTLNERVRLFQMSICSYFVVT
jgi:hypothetical protein